MDQAPKFETLTTRQAVGLSYKTTGDTILPLNTIQVLDELTNRNAVVSTGFVQYEIWAAQFYRYNRPSQHLTNGGLGSMSFGLPAAIGVALLGLMSFFVDIDGDESFTMNVQELQFRWRIFPFRQCY